ncbi:MAG TPA: Gfo/Idh/MocA family oxidoreductase [Bacillota bacterium]|nr:Gfo/Idh/MocA family oxidoreductase [Clostridiales bacterium]HPT84471.1 Gfo/Idh/MocA family oxidoreductase [Bacillota bacterium]
MSKVRVGIIGTGGISHFHMHGYLAQAENCEVVAACDINEPKLKAFGEKYGIKNLYTDYNEMLAKERLDAVSVTTWNSVHCPATVAALNAGVSVLCEKPMAMNTEEALRMEEAAKKNGKVLQIGFVRRFGMDTAAAKDFIDSGAAGDIYFAEVSYLRRNGCPGGWFGDKRYSGGGPLIDLGVHVMDLARYLAGRPKPVAAYGFTFSNIGPGGGSAEKAWTIEVSGEFEHNVEDFATGFIRFDNGFVMHVSASFVLNIKEDYGDVVLFGTKAGIKLGNPSEYYTSDGKNGVLDGEKYNKPSGFTEIFDYEVAHFVDCVKNGTPCIAPAEDGVMLMRMIDAIYESARTGKEAVIKY